MRASDLGFGVSLLLGWIRDGPVELLAWLWREERCGPQLLLIEQHMLLLPPVELELELELDVVVKKPSSDNIW